MAVTGVKDVRANLAKFNKQLLSNTEAAMDDVGKLGKEKAQNLTSIDTGDLFDSAFHEQINKGDDIGVVIGYQEKYAAAVHAMPEDTNWQRQGAENEFLTKGVLRHLSDFVNIIVDRMRKRF